VSDAQTPQQRAEGEAGIILNHYKVEKEKLDTEYGQIESNMNELTKFLHRPADPKTGRPPFLNPSQFLPLVDAVKGSVGFIIDMLSEIEERVVAPPIPQVTSETKHQASNQLQIPPMMLPMMAVNPMLMQQEQNKSFARNIGNFFSSLRRPQEKEPDDPSRILRETEVHSVLENFRQIIPMFSKFYKWYWGTISKRSFPQFQDREGYEDDNDEINAFFDKLSVILLSGSKSAIVRMKRRLNEYGKEMSKAMLMYSQLNSMAQAGINPMFAGPRNVIYGQPPAGRWEGEKEQ
jgi:hypothetical protein